MQFNLIDERWIPVKRRDGTATMMAPWEMTDRFPDNPVVALNAPRPDFNGALIQFLIGLVQTVAAPKNGFEWRKKLTEPPTQDELQTAFATVRHAFELGGDGPRFMQDFDELAVEAGSIDGLLIDTPGDNAKKKNTDHFVKRDMVSGMCPSCCSIALFAMQTNAPAGGVGYRTSLRGGGPLSTLIVGDGRHATLWQLVWLNVLEQNAFQNICGNPNLTDGRIFPWLATTRTSERNTGVESTPEDMHPAVMFWGMPRRIRLSLENIGAGVCDVCGKASNKLIQNYQEKNYGMNFTGVWLHPLSLYSSKDDVPLPVHPQPGGISYRHWLGLMQQDAGEKRMPARIVLEFYNRWKSGWQFRLWAFGYDMDSMKARCWYESTMPLLYVDAAIQPEYEQFVAGMVKAAAEIAGNARSAVKKAWFRRPGDVKGDTTFVGNSFWHQTESVFYETLESIRGALESGSDSLQARQMWHKALCEHALNLFDSYACDGPIEDADPKRVVLARKELENFNRGTKIKTLLGLPVAPKAAGKSAKKKEAA
ncbi:MAG: type I-E CRISPR-associated protein Cse1/CasA [Desulfurivibrionaceae bacterium]